MTNIGYEKGKLDGKAWMESPVYWQFNRNLRADEIMVLFLPPVQQDMMQISRPLPAPYKEWIRGFDEARRNAC